MSEFPKPVNRAKDPFGDESAPKVVPASMAAEIKPDTEGLPPAGHSRDEVMRERSEKLEEIISKMPERGGIDVSKFPLDNEIVSGFDSFGNCPVSNQQPGWVYKWKPAKDRATNYAQHQGFQLVQGDDPEGREHIGKHCAGATTLRGFGDCLLWRIPQAGWDKIEEAQREKGRSQGQVVERLDSSGEGYMARGGVGPNNPIVQRVYANSPMQAERMDTMMRRGSLPGATVNQIIGRR